MAAKRDKRSSFILVALVVLAGFCACNTRPAAETAELHVAAASDLIPAFEQIGREFEAKQKIKVVYSFGSTGLLTRQIENGAPMDVFAAASVDFIDQLEQKGLIINDTRVVYARGRITLWTPKDSQLQLSKVNDLTASEIKRIAIANPDHAPYGMAARDALQTAGVWDAVKPKLVYADNIRQTLEYAETGNVDVAIVALSLSQQSDGRWVLIPAELHKPINQGLAVIKETKNESAARAFSAFVSGAEGQAILEKFGFEKAK